jgi:hypothetical protein
LGHFPENTRRCCHRLRAMKPFVSGSQNTEHLPAL